MAEAGNSETEADAPKPVAPALACPRKKYKPLSEEETASLFDSDGRLIRENKLRQALFEGGVAATWRGHIWKFLFGIYPFNCTRREQKTIDLENRGRYKALQERWIVLDKTIHLPEEEPVCDPLEYLELSDEEDVTDFDNGLIYTLAEKVSSLDASCASSPNKLSKPLSSEQRSLSASSATSSQAGGASDQTLNDSVFENSNQDETRSTYRRSVGSSERPYDPECPYCNQELSRRNSSSRVLDEEGVALMQILEFPAKVFAIRQPVDLAKSYPKSKRVILRDVKRTDRVVHYFSHRRNLRKVHRILHIYAMFHPVIGYSQGMNDILARFLAVTDSEVDSYWMFCQFMEHKRPDFLEDTMMEKIALVQKLLSEVDIDLYNFFQSSECSDFLFCHRWLLLDFKREFHMADGLRMLEVLSSKYLELSGNKALIEYDRAKAEEFAMEQGEIRNTGSGLNNEFTFDLFICVAILRLHCSIMSEEKDAASVYSFLNSLCTNMDLDEVLQEAETLLLRYCRQSGSRGFHEITM